MSSSLKPIPIVLSGLPGRMALLSARAIVDSAPDFRLLRRAFSGEARSGETYRVEGGGAPFQLLGPPSADKLRELAAEEPGLLLLDFSSPQAATPNALACAEAGLWFAAGTTGLDAGRVRAAVEKAGVSAVAAPNFAGPIVALGAALRWAAERFPGALAGFELSVRESHQAAKRDVSGTARAFLEPFSRLAGEQFGPERIESIRDPGAQRAMGIPEEALSGHAWHRYEMISSDGAASLALEHVVLGRDLYKNGVLLALRFLAARRRRGAESPGAAGKLYGMEDVLSGSGVF